MRKKTEVCNRCLCLRRVDPAPLCKDRYPSAGLRRGNDQQRNWERGSPAEAEWRNLERAGETGPQQEREVKSQGGVANVLHLSPKSSTRPWLCAHHVHGFLRLMMTPLKIQIYLTLASALALPDREREQQSVLLYLKQWLQPPSRSRCSLILRLKHEHV